VLFEIFVVKAFFFNLVWMEFLIVSANEAEKTFIDLRRGTGKKEDVR
jgi:hypothetical protein